jgi:hypothetical protein
LTREKEKVKQKGGRVARVETARDPIGIVFKSTAIGERLVGELGREENPGMGKVAGILAVAAVALGVYYYYLKKLPTTDQGPAATQAVSLTGVRMDLLQIAQAERGNVALDGKCVTLDELISSGALTMDKKERDGYAYDVSCNGGDFQVTAEHPTAAEGSGIRYSKLMIDGTMQVREVQ